MKTNSSYLPLFFLCWAFLYTPLAVLSAFPSGAKEQDTIDPGALHGPGICGQVDFAPVNGDGLKPYSCFDGTSFVPRREQFLVDTIGLMHKRFFGYGVK